MACNLDLSPAFTRVGDTVQFAEYIERNIRLYHIRNLYPLRPQSAASWIRQSLAESLRSRSPYTVNLLIGGFDTAGNLPHLYWVDYLGTMASVPFAAHGYGSFFALSLLDRWVSLLLYCPFLRDGFRLPPSPNGPRPLQCSIIG